MGAVYPLALFLATCVGVLFNFKTTGTLVFKVQGYQPLAKFIGSYLFTYFINLALVGLINRRLNNPYLSGFLAIFPTAAISFVLSKYIVFRNQCEIN